METKWGHKILYTKKGDRVKAQCRGSGCGWQTPWLNKVSEAVQLGKAHTGLVEKERDAAGH